MATQMFVEPVTRGASRSRGHSGEMKADESLSRTSRYLKPSVTSALPVTYVVSPPRLVEASRPGETPEFEARPSRLSRQVISERPSRELSRDPALSRRSSVIVAPSRLSAPPPITGSAPRYVTTPRSSLGAETVPAPVVYMQTSRPSPLSFYSSEPGTWPPQRMQSAPPASRFYSAPQPSSFYGTPQASGFLTPQPCSYGLHSQTPTRQRSVSPAQPLLEDAARYAAELATAPYRPIGEVHWNFPKMEFKFVKDERYERPAAPEKPKSRGKSMENLESQIQKLLEVQRALDEELKELKLKSSSNQKELEAFRQARSPVAKAAPDAPAAAPMLGAQATQPQSSPKAERPVHEDYMERLSGHASNFHEAYTAPAARNIQQAFSAMSAKTDGAKTDESRGVDCWSCTK